MMDMQASVNGGAQPTAPSKTHGLGAKRGKITARRVRYIRLGTQSHWWPRCRAEGSLYLAFAEIPHELALTGYKAGIQQVYRDQGKSAAVASRFANQLCDFYQDDRETLWVTLADGQLWWCFAHPEVLPLNGRNDPESPQGARMRYTLDGWHGTDIKGRPILAQDLPDSLGVPSSYRHAICAVPDEAAILQRINADG